MHDSVSAIRLFSLERWVGLPAGRARCLGHFLAIAATLAAAKVLLSTVAVALFVAEQGAAGLPPFYLGFAAIAILLSFGLSAIIDRAPKVRLAQITFAGLLLGTVALRLLLALELPGASFSLLASATAFEIIFDILFWVVVAAYLDAFEFRRATPLVYMAFALGGAAGGAVARVGAAALPAADLLLLLLPFAAVVVVQLGTVARRLREMPEYHTHADDEGAQRSGLVLLGRVARRYPLALLIALNALAGTLLYGLSEFLIFSIYEARFANETELAEFLSLLFALMQVLEFGLLYTLTRVLLERAGPLLRNLVFPLTSLAGLAFLAVSPRLLSAVIVHVNIEAGANAILLPISNANYVPLPLAVQGRARTLSEGIFYPLGLALAGAILWQVDPAAATLQVQFAALVFAGLFVLLGLGVGLLFLPTLRANVGAGLIARGQAPSPAAAPPSAPRVSALLHSREPELQLLGIALARRLDPAVLEPELRNLARRSGRATRTALAPLVAAAAGPCAQRFLDRCLAGGTEEELELALIALLIRRAPPRSEQLTRGLDARDPSVVALAHVVAKGAGARSDIRPLVRTPQVASDLIDWIVSAGRTDCAPLLLACLDSAGPEQQHRALVMLNASAPPSREPPRELLRLLARGRDPALRAEAIVALSRTSPRAAALRRTGTLPARRASAGPAAPPSRHRRRGQHGRRLDPRVDRLAARPPAPRRLCPPAPVRRRAHRAAAPADRGGAGARALGGTRAVSPGPPRAHRRRRSGGALAGKRPPAHASSAGCPPWRGPAPPRERVRARGGEPRFPPRTGRGRTAALPPVRAWRRSRAAGRSRHGTAARAGRRLDEPVGPPRRDRVERVPLATTSTPPSGTRRRTSGAES